MIYIHETADFKCYFKWLEPKKISTYGKNDYAPGILLYILYNRGYPRSIGDEIEFGLNWSKPATEEEIKQLYKLITFQ